MISILEQVDFAPNNSRPNEFLVMYLNICRLVVIFNIWTLDNLELVFFFFSYVLLILSFLICSNVVCMPKVLHFMKMVDLAVVFVGFELMGFVCTATFSLVYYEVCRVSVDT